MKYDEGVFLFISHSTPLGHILHSFSHLSRGTNVINIFAYTYGKANFLFHNSHDKFDRQLKVSNQINQIES